MEIKLTDTQKALIEKYGVLLERFGISPVAARVNSLLTITDEEALTFEQIRGLLNISKSATSTALNTLVLLGYVGYKTELGDRKRYFYSEIKSWKNKMERDLMSTQELASVLDEIKENKTDRDLGQLKDVTEYSNFLKTLVRISLEELKKE